MSLLSIIHEFSVLYSSRVLQRDKKWGDGRLRYYELNNKIEVLNDDMLIVGSDFYPHHARKPLESGVFSDGNEYVFPSGKLMVEFNEYLGCFERDLSNVFAKKDVAVKRESDAQIEQFLQASMAVSAEKSNNISPRQTGAIKSETKDIEVVRESKLSRLPSTVGRPIGLRKKPQQAKKSTPRPSMSDQVCTKLDSSFSSSEKVCRRIPPGSNRISRRFPIDSMFQSLDDKASKK